MKTAVYIEITLGEITKRYQAYNEKEDWQLSPFLPGAGFSPK
jgi:hypothetical protein